MTSRSNSPTVRNSISFIHAISFFLLKTGRASSGNVTSPSSHHSPPVRLRSLYSPRQLVPGGYLELQCLLPVPNCDDDSAPPESGVPIFSTKVIEASQIVGWSLLEPNNFAKYLREAGFVNVVEKRYKVPTGPWPLNKRLKLIGAFEMQSLLQGASAFSLMAFSKAFGWTKEETEVFLVALRRDVKNLRYHTYYEL